MHSMKIKDFCELANQDGALSRGLRFLDTSILCKMGEKSWGLVVKDAQLRPIDAAKINETDFGVVLSADDQVWKEMLQSIPAPFYHTLSSAQAHGLQMISQDPLTCFQYIGALERMLAIMRDIYNAGGGRK